MYVTPRCNSRDMAEDSTEMEFVDHLRAASTSVEAAIGALHESDEITDTTRWIKHAFTRGQLHAALGIIKSVIDDES